MAAPDARPDLTDVVIRMAGVAVRRGSSDAARRRRLGRRAGRTVGRARPQRRGQDHAAAPGGRGDAPDRRARSTCSASGSAGSTSWSCAPASGCRRRTSACGCPATRRWPTSSSARATGCSGRWRERYEATDTDRADRLLDALGMHGLAARTFGTLSEGERKRTLIARALMTDPELLLLDEPAAGLDLGGREELVSRLSGLALDPDAPASVLVTHHVEEIPLGLHARAAAARGPDRRVRAAGRRAHRRGADRDVRAAARGREAPRSLHGLGPLKSACQRVASRLEPPRRTVGPWTSTLTSTLDIHVRPLRRDEAEVLDTSIRRALTAEPPPALPFADSPS